MTANWGPDTPPVRLCCGQPHSGAMCPDGKVMCCICFSRFPVGELHTDPVDGKKVDVCKGCEALNEAARERRRS
jgi:hypothetical protein